MTLEETIDTYCRAWSEPSADERAQALAQVWTPGATYTDPTVFAAGAAELLAHIDGVVAKRPGARVVRTSELGVHHGCVRFEWCVVLADGQRLPTGLDIAFMGADGRIDRIIGFFGHLAPLART
jgi:hypothetical protein